MNRQNIAFKEDLDEFVNISPYLQNGEISGIKLRDSLFIVYSCNDLVSGSEFIYNLKSMDGSGEMIFDINMETSISTGGTDNCGVYKLEDGRILAIINMKDWHFKGFFFKDEKEWVQYSEYAERNSFNGE